MDDCCSRKGETLNLLAQSDQRRILVMASTFGCSRNDVIVNVGVLVAAGLMAWTARGWPDVLACAIIAILFLRSAARVLRSAWPVWQRRVGTVELD